MVESTEVAAIDVLIARDAGEFYPKAQVVILTD